MGQYQSHGLVTEMHPQLLIHDYLASTEKKSPETAGPVSEREPGDSLQPPSHRMDFSFLRPVKPYSKNVYRFVLGVLVTGPPPRRLPDLSDVPLLLLLATAHDQTSRTYQF